MASFTVCIKKLKVRSYFVCVVKVDSQAHCRLTIGNACRDFLLGIYALQGRHNTLADLEEAAQI